jgi:hypothetical protein
MNTSTQEIMERVNRVIGCPRRKWSTTLRFVAILVAATSLSLVLAACGSPSENAVAQLGSTTTTTQTGSSSTSSASAQVSEALAFARCMRSKGVTNFPDPNANGEFNKVTMSQLSTSNSRYQTATQSCAHLFPGISGKSPSQVLAQQIANDEAKFVRCMRSHGVSNWPNPVLEQGRLVFNSQAVGIDPTSPRIAAKMQACDYVFPASVGVPPGAGHNPNT